MRVVSIITVCTTLHFPSLDFCAQEHLIHIPDSSILLVVPPDFEVSQEFLGLQSSDGPIRKKVAELTYSL
jgi:hypothetical protein